jgi:hypothetical protein
MSASSGLLQFGTRKSVIIAPTQWGENEGKTGNLRVVWRDGRGAERQRDVQGAQGQHGRVQEVWDHLRLHRKDLP